MILTGLARLGRDAEIRFVPSGEAVCNLSLAFNYGKKATGEQHRPSQWVDASLWGKRAEALAPYLLKGGLVDVVLGDPHIETFEGKNGTGTKLSARVLEIELAGDGGGRESKQEDRPAPKQEPKPAAFHDGLEDDIPF